MLVSRVAVAVVGGGGCSVYVVGARRVYVMQFVLKPEKRWKG